MLAPRGASGRRALVVALLGAWVALGLYGTVGGVRGRIASHRITAAAGLDVVGMPLRGAHEVHVVRALMAHVEETGVRWLVVLPDRVEPFVRDYIAFQLAHLEYPRRVDVVTGPSVPPHGDYGAAIAISGVPAAGDWSAVAAAAGFTLYLRSTP